MSARPVRRILTSICLVALALATVAAAEDTAPIDIDSNTFGGLGARAIGPAVMSGRVAALDAVATDPLTIYVGAASGGVWKSKDGGIAFEPIFDDHTQSIGAIRVDPSDPETVWVGTGESWVRNSVSVGDGVYKSEDGGETWKHLGLADSERIATIVVDPNDGDVVYVCATGHAWNANEERGVFKSEDGGESWRKVLYVDADTGCSDLEIDPQDPRILYAGMWQYRRYPDFFTSGGPGSGLYKSTDAGATWSRLEAGLPEGELGRITVAVAPSRPSVVYAIVEAEETALYRSDDVGASWNKVNTSGNVQMRPFYFGTLEVDPYDYDRVYRPAFTLTISTDGGKSFSAMFGSGFTIAVHPDHHALWINPDNPHQLVLGTDGGVYVSESRAATWRHVRSLPISQFYRVSHDGEWPYNVYGGLQDNGSWTGPSRAPGGVQNKHWDMVGQGDGFWVFADPRDPDIVYSEYQGGQLARVRRSTGTYKSIKPYPEEDQEPLRFNWNTPFHISPNDPKTIYYGSQYLHRSQDRGDSWQTISPDLTTDDPQRQRQLQSGGLTIDNSTAENNATIYSISESPADDAVIWVGTDDGNLQVSDDGGESWRDVAPATGVPAGTWVSTVAASPHDARTAFVTFDGHRTGDMTPYVLRTDDLGATWTSLSSDEIDGWAWVIRQDPVNPALLYLGTERGLFISVDGGQNWARFEEDLPKVAVHEIVVHPTEHDVILATHGRGVYIIDDITPLRHLTNEVLASKVALLPSRPAVMVLASPFGFFRFGDGEFIGANPGATANIVYYLARRHLFGDLRVEIYDGEDKIASLQGGKRKGLNRVEWPMFLKPPKLPPSTALVQAFSGPRVPEGTYRVKLIKGDETIDGEVRLVPDPRNPHSEEARKLQQRTALRLYDRLADLTFLAERTRELREQAEARAEATGDRRAKRRLEALAGDLDTLGETLAVREGGLISGQERLRERLGNLYGDVAGYDGPPTDSQLQRADALEAQLAEAQARYDALVAEHLETINTALRKDGLEPLVPVERDTWDAREDGGTSAAAAAWLAQRLPDLFALALGAL